MKYMGDRLKYWEARTTFPPTGSVIEIFVDGLPDDDMEIQHRFFLRLVEDWPTLVKRVERLLLERLQLSSRQKISSQDSVLGVSSVSIPRGPIESSDWEISFLNEDDPERPLRITMKGQEPQGVTLDG